MELPAADQIASVQSAEHPRFSNDGALAWQKASCSIRTYTPQWCTLTEVSQQQPGRRFGVAGGRCDGETVMGNTSRSEPTRTLHLVGGVGEGVQICSQASITHGMFYASPLD